MLEINPLGPNLGAEVTGVDLRSDPGPEVARALNQALLDHLVLIIKDQDLTAPEFLGAIAPFGRPMLQHRSGFRLPDHPEIGRIINREGLKPASMWHCDHTNHECPPKATVLYARTLPKKGGDTCVASMYRGLDALPADLRARLDDMVSVNSLEPDTPTYSSDDRAKYTGGVRHPMVRTHPETGRKALFFHLTKSQAIDGMADEEVRPFLEDLLDRSVQPEWAYCHKWTLGDLLILDNRCTMHRADPDYDQTEERLLWRIILEGDRPV